jgi:hypothetical protein
MSISYEKYFFEAIKAARVSRTRNKIFKKLFLKLIDGKAFLLMRYFPGELWIKFQSIYVT